jgi:hypothetical protein
MVGLRVVGLRGSGCECRPGGMEFEPPGRWCRGVWDNRHGQCRDDRWQVDADGNGDVPVDDIYAKLGVRSRAALATEAAKNRTS